MKIATAAVAATLVLASPAFAACETMVSKNVKLSACIDGATWSAQPAEVGQERLYFSADGVAGFTIVAEDAKVPVDDYRTAILNNAVGAALDAKPENVRVVAERKETVADKEWNVIEYEVTTADAALLFQNFYYVEPSFGSTQFVFWSLPEGATSTAYRAGQVLSTVAFPE